MIVFRISKKKRISDLSGAGAKNVGGRWNPKGHPVVFTAGNSSLAILETMVHLDFDILPSDLMIAEIEIPSHIKIKRIKEEELPTNWNVYPSPDILKHIGKEWLIENEFLVLEVPSSVNQNDCNYIINPNNRLFSEIRIKRTFKFALDERLGT